MYSGLFIPVNVGVILAAYLYGAGFTVNDITQRIPAWTGLRSSNMTLASYTCDSKLMEPKFLAFDPIMVYLENFLTPFEAQYLKELA
jgi:hypothetical protein